MSAPKVSVCVPTYNHAGYIGQALDGILAQEVDFAYEIIVADDFSTDGTRDVVLAYAARHPERFRLILQPMNTRGRANFDELFAAPRGEYVAFVDGDDYWTSPVKLKRQVDLLDAHPEYAAVCHDVRLFDETGPLSLYSPPGLPEVLAFEDAVHDFPALMCSFVYRRSALERLPPWFLELSAKSGIGDMIVLAILAASGKVRYLPEVWAAYRQHAGGFWSQRDPLEREERLVTLYEGLLPHFAEHAVAIRTEIWLRRIRLARSYFNRRRFPDAARHLVEGVRHVGAVPRWSDRATMARAEARELWSLLRTSSTAKVPLELRRTANLVVGRTPSWERARSRYGEASHT